MLDYQREKILSLDEINTEKFRRDVKLLRAKALVDKGYDLSNEDIAKPIEIRGNTLSQHLKSVDVTPTIYRKFYEHYGNEIIEFIDRLNGKAKPSKLKRIDMPEILPTAEKGSLALRDEYSSAGLGNTFNQDQVTIPTGYIKIPGYERCNFTKIITGHSMNDTLRNGDRVIGEQVQNLKSFEWGEIYNIVTREHDITKRVNDDEEDEKFIWCTSDNQEAKGAKGKLRYQPIHILKKEIISAAYIRAAFNPIG